MSADLAPAATSTSWTSPPSATPGQKLAPTQRDAFGRARAAAVRVLRRRFRLLRLARGAYDKYLSKQRHVRAVKHDLYAMIRLARAWARREYREVPWKTVLYAVAALVYFVNPIDAIPDAFALIGFVDDVAVVGAVGRAIHQDLQRFRTWERADRDGSGPATETDERVPTPQ